MEEVPGRQTSSFCFGFLIVAVEQVVCGRLGLEGKGEVYVDMKLSLLEGLAHRRKGWRMSTLVLGVGKVYKGKKKSGKGHLAAIKMEASTIALRTHFEKIQCDKKGAGQVWCDAEGMRYLEQTSSSHWAPNIAPVLGSSNNPRRNGNTSRLSPPAISCDTFTNAL